MLYRRLLGGLLSLFVLACVVAPTSGQEKATLAWKFPQKDGKFQPFYQTMTTRTEQTMNVLNNDVKQVQVQTFVFEWTPTDFNDKDKKVTIKQKIYSVKMDIDIGNQKISYDSNSPQAGSHPLNEFFNALKGSEFTLTIDLNSGKVTDIKGREEFVQKLTKANQAMKPLLEQILSDNALKQMAEPTFGAIRNGQEVIKDSQKENEGWWNRSTKLEMGPIGTYENTYKYIYKGKGQGEDAKLDVLDVETTLKYTAPGDAPAGTALPFKIKSAQLTSKNAKGKVYFNAETGRIEKSDMSVELDGTLSIEIGGQTTEVKLSQKQTSEVRTSNDPPK
jgi:hypothetical protein